MDCAMPALFFRHTDYFSKIQCKALPSGGVSADDFQSPERCGKPGSAVLGIASRGASCPCGLCLSRVEMYWTLDTLFSGAHPWMEGLQLTIEL